MSVSCSGRRFVGLLWSRNAPKLPPYSSCTWSGQAEPCMHLESRKCKLGNKCAPWTAAAAAAAAAAVRKNRPRCMKIPRRPAAAQDHDEIWDKWKVFQCKSRRGRGSEEEEQVRPKLPLGPPKEERRRRSPVKRNCALLLQYPSTFRRSVPPLYSKGALKTSWNWPNVGAENASICRFAKCDSFDPVLSLQTIQIWSQPACQVINHWDVRFCCKDFHWIFLA